MPDEPTTQADAKPSVQQLRDRAVSGVIAVAFRSVSIRLMGLASNVVLARVLTPADFGLVAVGLSIVSVGGFFTSGGLAAALVRQEAEPTHYQLRAAFGVQLLIGVLVAVVALAIGIPLGTAGTVAAIMTVSLPIDIFRVPSAIVAQRKLLFGPIVRAEIGEMVAYNLVAVVLVLLGAGVWGIAASVVARAVVGSTLLIAGGSVGLLRPALSFSTIKPMLRFGLTLQASNLIQLVRGQGLIFATAGIGGVSTLGLWSFSNRLLLPVNLLFETVGRVAFPAMSGLIRAGENAKPLVEKGLRLGYGVGGLGVVAVTAASPALVPSVFGAKWNEAISINPVSLLGLFISGPIVAAATGYLSAVGDANRILRSTIVHSIAWVAVSLPLLPSLGAVALGWGWVAAGLVDMLFLRHALRRHAPIRVISTSLPPLLIAVVVAPSGWLVEDHLGPTLYAAAIAGALATLLYLAGMWIFRRDTARELLALLKRLMRRSGTATA